MIKLAYEYLPLSPVKSQLKCVGGSGSEQLSNPANVTRILHHKAPRVATLPPKSSLCFSYSMDD